MVGDAAYSFDTAIEGKLLACLGNLSTAPEFQSTDQIFTGTLTALAPTKGNLYSLNDCGHNNKQTNSHKFQDKETRKNKNINSPFSYGNISFES